MLTAIGLATARRLRVGGAHSASHAARLALRVSARSAIVVPSSLRIAAVFKRSFAAARTVRAPKSGATGKTTKKTTTAATKTKAKKKPAAAKAKKPKTAKKAKKVKKKAPVKAKKPKKAKKVLTEEEKKKLKIKKLRQDALLKEQPSELPSKGWQVFVVSKSKDATAGTRITDVMKNLSQQYKALSPADKAALEAAAKRNKAANDVALASWITTRTADEIATANRARATLRRLGFKSKFRLHDPRAGPAKLGPYIVFSKERWASGDFATTTAVEASRKIGREWKALSDTEREAYRQHENVV